MNKHREKICFLGFSVTAENKGYVEFLEEVSGIHVDKKIAIGGIHPHHAKYIFIDIIENLDVDYVVLEWGTSSFRSFLGKKEYILALVCIIDLMLKKNIVPIILDLPRKDVSWEDDWVSALHLQISRKFFIPHIDLRPDTLKFFGSYDKFLRDVVHPTIEGSKFYAEALSKELAILLREQKGISSCVRLSSVFSQDISEFYKCIICSDLMRSETVNFKRSGFTLHFVKIPIEKSRTVKGIPMGYKLVGVSYLMGPDTGVLTITGGQAIRKVKAYDQFCYYTRVGATLFEGVDAEELTFHQSPELLDIELLKGDVNSGDRCGYLGHIFLVKDGEEVLGSEIFEYFSSLF